MSEPRAEWCDVLQAELEALRGEPPAASSGTPPTHLRLQQLHERLHHAELSALCLSGGGIRSATFALGVLQGLAYAGVLGSIDYLSTVSGGGYIGGWFTTWLHRRGEHGRDAVLETMDPGLRAHSDGCSPRGDGGISPIDRVRQTCRYLALRGGVVSADVWTLIATMARNLVLNWMVILPLLGAALMVPRLYYGGVQGVERGFTTGPCAVVGDAAWWSGVATLACFVVCTLYTVLNFVGFGARWSQGRFLGWFLLPAVGGVVAYTFFCAAYPCRLPLGFVLGLSALVPTIGWIVLGIVAHLRPRSSALDGGTLRIKVGARTALAAAVAGPILGGGAWWLTSFDYGFGAGDALRQLYAVAAVPIVLVLILLQITVFIGIASNELQDAELEWWSRCGAWLGIAAVLWLGAGVLVFSMADAIEWLVRTVSRAIAVDQRPTSAFFAVLVPLLSSLAGIAARAGGKKGTPSPARAVFQTVALPAVIFLLLSTIAWVDLRATEALEYHHYDAATLCSESLGAPCHPPGGGMGENLGLAVGLFAVGLFVSVFVPVNRFSLHGMYQQRLIRTFLGSSRDDRHPNAFTGFDQNDDVRVHELADVRPLHVINATLNAVSSTHLGRRETLAQSFSFTPLYVGNRDVGYRRAAEYGSDGGAKGTGLSLGMALAVSGAAASPAMGMYSTKARAFLLTLANARLGLWFGNPRSARRWQSSEPPSSVGPLLRELLGLTTDHNPYVYLSDGGHYENLGLWEMVARRCRTIVVSDAGCDPAYTFDDLGNAVRRIRLDLGIPIIFPQLDFTRAGQGTSNPHAAIGKIRYSVVDGPDAPDGVIVYIKATLSGDEPVDVRNFATTDPTFPHDSTGNQFFDEARFESYRLLGFHSVLSITGGLRNLRTASELCDAARDSLAAIPAARPA